MPTDTPRTTVVHVRDPYDVYIGRAMPRQRMQASPFANPFRIGRDGTREDVIAKYRAWIVTRPDLLAIIPTLRGKRLACWCAPLACHGDVLAAMADAPTDDLAAMDPDTAEAYARMEAKQHLCRSCGEPELWRDGYCYDCWEVADFARIGKGVRDES